MILKIRFTPRSLIVWITISLVVLSACGAGEPTAGSVAFGQVAGGKITTITATSAVDIEFVATGNGPRDLLNLVNIIPSIVKLRSGETKVLFAEAFDESSTPGRVR